MEYGIWFVSYARAATGAGLHDSLYPVLRSEGRMISVSVGV
jgi:hypothetical protein